MFGIVTPTYGQTELPAQVPGVPTEFQVTPIPNSTNAELSWSSPNEGGRVDRIEFDMPAWRDGWILLTSTYITCTGIAFVANMPYQIRIRAVNAQGPGPATEWVTVIFPYCAPSPPLAVSAMVVAANQFMIVWQPPENNGNSPISNYGILRRELGETKWSTIVRRSRGHLDTRYIDTVPDSATATSFEYIVEAQNQVRAKGWSDTVLGDLLAPARINAQVRSHDRVRVRWLAPFNDATDPVPEYRVERLTADDTWTELDEPVQTDASMFIIDDRTAADARSQVHSYRVVAVRNQDGNVNLAYSGVAASDPTAPLPPVPELDLNGDSFLTVHDALVLYYHLTVSNLAAADSMGANLRQTFLGNLQLRNHSTPSDTMLQGWLTKAQQWAEVEGSTLDGDVINVGAGPSISAADALVLYYVLEFPDLLGGGRTSLDATGIQAGLLQTLFEGDNVTDPEASWQQAMAAARDLLRR